MTYLINEGSLTVTAADDRSINVFALVNELGAPLQAIITRDKGETGEPLAESVARQIKTLSRQVKNFKSIPKHITEKYRNILEDKIKIETITKIITSKYVGDIKEDLRAQASLDL